MTGELPPVRREVVVATDPATAFDIWTGEIGLWWPLDTLSVSGGDSTVSFVDGRLVERSADGDESVWGEILVWEPPHRLRITWHPGADTGPSTEVEVVFAAVSEGFDGRPATLVTLTHERWENLAEPEAARTEYDSGWPQVVRLFADAVHRRAPDDTEVWLALRHSAGPNAPAADEIFGHPDFTAHVEFLHRLSADGVLVAAGPTGVVDESALVTGANGMTVVRAANAAQAAELVRQARFEDGSVVRGLFVVDVSRWHVRMTSR